MSAPRRGSYAGSAWQDEVERLSPQVENPPGQPTLAYRAGIHPTFLRRMLARLSSPPAEGPALPALTTRASDDPALALLDAWAVVADVLTFYQERVANEGYLRTASERRSILELARSIGYELRPGVAASTFLSFTVEDAPGSPGVTTVPRGTQVQSIPAQGKLPQTFETLEEITARAEWNAVRPRLTQPQHVVIGPAPESEAEFMLYAIVDAMGSMADEAVGVVQIPVADLFFVGLTLPDPNLAIGPDPNNEEEKKLYRMDTTDDLTADAGNVVELRVDELFPRPAFVSEDVVKAIEIHNMSVVRVDELSLKGAASLTVGNLLLVVGGSLLGGGTRTLTLRIDGVEAETHADRVWVDVTEPAKPRPGSSLKRKQSRSVLSIGPHQGVQFRREFPASRLDAVRVGQAVLSQSVTESALSAVVSMSFWNPQATQGMVNQLAARPSPKLPGLGPELTLDRTRGGGGGGELDPPADEDQPAEQPDFPAPPLPGALPGVFGFRERVGFFGHNAPPHQALTSPEHLRGDPYPNSWDGVENERTIWSNSQGDPYTEANVYLERSLPEVLRGSWVLFEASSGSRKAYRVRGIREASLADYGLSGKATGLELENADGSEPPEESSQEPVPRTKLPVRKTTAYVQSEPLELTDLPIDDEVAEGDTVLMLDGFVLGLPVGHPLMLSGERADAPGVVEHTAVHLADVVHIQGYTVLLFQQGLPVSLVRKTVKLNANVVRATHGETVEEVLGSGDSTRPPQRFFLNKPPLTFVSAPTLDGTKSTLQVRVNRVLWEEAPSLFGLDAQSQRYMVRLEDSGAVTVTFGDGEHSARLPSGAENVSASYRSGIGSDGEVASDSLTLLKTRPLGIRGVTNPLPATGAAAPERLDEARTTAPQRVLTLDRIVSLQDYEDFARTLAGIGKAQATQLQVGETGCVHITIAAANGAPIHPDSDLLRNLVKAIDSLRAPGPPVLVASYELRLFNIAAKVLVDSRHQATEVLEQVAAVLEATFAFATRTFGQAVTAAEVMGVIHTIEGVVATDLDGLYLATDRPQMASRLRATPARVERERRRGARAGLVFDSARLLRAPVMTTEIRPAQLLLAYPAGITLTEMAP